MFEQGWRDERICRENYHRSDPAGDESVDADRFYTWGALAPALRMLQEGEATLPILTTT